MPKIWNLITQGFGGLTDGIGGLWDTISGFAKDFNIGDNVLNPIKSLFDRLMSFISGTQDKVRNSVDKDAGQVNTALTTALDVETVFKPLVKSCGLDEAVATDLHTQAADALTAYLSGGIPKPDRYGKPTTAIKPAADAAKKAFDLLNGKDDDIGQLAAAIPDLAKPENDAKRKNLAVAMVYSIYGIKLSPEGEYDMKALASNPPTTGLASAFIRAQAAAYADGHKDDGTLAAADLAVTFDPSLLNATLGATNVPIHKNIVNNAKDQAANPNINNSMTVNDHGVPPAGGVKHGWKLNAQQRGA